MMQKNSINTMFYERSGNAFQDYPQDYPRDNPLGTAPGRCAAEAGLSVSAYLRAAGLNHPVRSVLDLRAVTDMGRVNGDLGRVAGLLKLWLAEKQGHGAYPADVEALLRRFWALQTELHLIMGRAVRNA